MSSVVEPTFEPTSVLAAYAEPIANGRRVLFIGPALSALPGHLVERGARVVHVCDPDAVRVSEATVKNRTGNISYSALSDGHFALRDGAFDVCIVEDAGIADPVPLMKRIRRALSPRGVALVASQNSEVRAPLMKHRPSGVIALDYYALYDAVKAEFEHVRMLGQAPFVGYVIADFAPDGAPEPSLDTAFLPNGAEEPELFLAVASQQPVNLEAFAVVQLPYRSVVTAAAGDGDALRRARAKLSELETELTTERQSVAQRDGKLREAETKVFARDAELAALRQELEHKSQQLKSQEAKLSELSAKLNQGPSAEEQSAHTQELAALEKTLAERGEHIRKLERDLREAERTGKELLRQLPPASDAAETLRKAAESELAQKLAKSQADLIATRWALEAAVKRGAGAAEPPDA
jgi:hypothetical protein